MRKLVMDRRTFLKAAGAGTAAVLVAPAVLAQAPSALPAAPALDPVLAQAMALDFDRDRILRFVADEVAYEPYAGVLRGAATTLAGRAGNGADKAVLLAALLDAALIETRFVTGTLDDAAAATLAATTADRDARARGRGGPPGRTPRRRPSPSPDPATQAIIDRMPEIDASVTAWASDAIDTSVRQITEALAGAGISLPTGPAPLPDTERTRHLWVQARSGTEWVDLDPTLAGTEPGRPSPRRSASRSPRSPTTCATGSTSTSCSRRWPVPASTQEAIIEHSRFADELADVPIAIGHAKPEALQAARVRASSRCSWAAPAISPSSRWGPTAYVGLSPLILAGGDAADPSAGPTCSGPSAAGPREGEAVAEWLELRITAPDGTVTYGTPDPVRPGRRGGPSRGTGGPRGHPAGGARGPRCRPPGRVPAADGRPVPVGRHGCQGLAVGRVPRGPGGARAGHPGPDVSRHPGRHERQPVARRGGSRSISRRPT